MKLFGEYLVEQGEITQSQLTDALLRQDRTIVPLGEIAVEERLLTPQQVRAIRVTQRRLDQRLGEIAVEREWLTTEQLQHLLAAQADRHVLLGDLLVELGMLEHRRLEEQAARFRQLQEEQSARMAALIDSNPNGHVLRVLLDFTAKHFLRATAEPVRLTLLEYHEALAPPPDGAAPLHFVAQHASGEGSLTFGLLVDEPAMLFIASRMLEEEQDEVDEMVADSLRELVNMIVGNAFAHLSLDGVRLRPRAPVVMSAREAARCLTSCTRTRMQSRRGAFDAVVAFA